MTHYTDKDMTSEEFCNLLEDRLQKGESIDGYSYSSTNGIKVEIKNSEDKYYDVLEWIAILLIVVGITLLLVS